MIHLHVDADDLWIYEREYGVDPSPRAASVYDDALPRLLDIFTESNVKATFFVVGCDLHNQAARDFCRVASALGHEIANHSYSHPLDLRNLSRQEQNREIQLAHEMIAEATGVEPVGFRAPGYALDGSIVELLVASGYLYDSSVLPSFVMPLTALYIDLAARRRTGKRIGSFQMALASQRLRTLRVAGGSLIELPISVIPGARLPIHSTFAFQMPPRLRRAAYAATARSRDIAYLFHAVDGSSYPASDLLSARVLPLRIPLERRLALIREAVTRFPAHATSREILATLDPSNVRVSRLLRWPHRQTDGR